MPGGSVSSACLLRQVSSGLSRNCRNERRPAAAIFRRLIRIVLERCSHYCELVSDPRTDPSCPESRHSERDLAPQHLCDRSYDEVDLAR